MREVPDGLKEFSGRVKIRKSEIPEVRHGIHRKLRPLPGIPDRAPPHVASISTAFRPPPLIKKTGKPARVLRNARKPV